MNLSPDDEDTVPHLPSTRAHGVCAARWGAKSSIGLIRKANEDSWGQLDSALFVVADGMGGSAGGARASAVAVAEFLNVDSADGWIQAVRQVNDRVRDACDADGYPAAGTTLVAVIFEGDRVTSISIGDSRVYRLRNRKLVLVTKDHNLGNLRAEEGLDPSGRDDRGKPAALTSFLGNPDAEQRIDVGTITAQAGDRILLCSDGVHGQIVHNEIAILLGSSTCQLAAERLVEAADNAGGRDNATALVLEIGDGID